jgi:hypothetical protein
VFVNQIQLICDHEGIPHHITSMITKFDHSYTSFNIPQHASHVARAGDDLSIVYKSTAAEITGMCAQLASAPRTRAVLVIQVVDGADIVEAAAGDKIAGWRISAGHNPARSQGYSMNFVCGVSVPNY